MNIPRRLHRAWRQAMGDLGGSEPLRGLPILQRVRPYPRESLRRDLSAGLGVALLALPQGLAFAVIAGIPLHHGIYGTIAGLALGPLFSGARHASFGPSITIAVLLAGTFAQLDIAPDLRAEVVTLVLLVSGIVLAGGAWLRLAMLARFISRSVTTGFVVAAGVLIAGSQLKHVLGLRLDETGVFLENAISLILALPETHWPSLLVAAITAGIYLAIRIQNRSGMLPAAAFAIVGASVGAWFLAEGGHPTEQLEALERRLIPAHAAPIELSWLGVMANTAFATALLSMLEVSMIGRLFAARAGERFEARQHMLALGLTNLGNAFFAGMPASISLPRSRLNWQLGAATPLAGVAASLFCAVLFIAVAPWIGLIPLPALAALAIIMATEIVRRHNLRVILNAGGADAVVLIATILCGLLMRLDIALYIGTGLSIVFFLRRVGVPELSEYGFTDEGHLAAVDEPEQRRNPDISIVHVEGDLFFGAAEILLEQVRRICEDPNLKVIVLRMKNAHRLDATCALAIEELLRFARDRDRHIIVSGAHREIFRVFRNSGLLAELGRENFFMEVPSNPTLSTRNALRRAQKLLGTREANIRIYVDPAKKATGPASGA